MPGGEPFRFLSVCSGIESASVAFEPLGWRALAFAEVDAMARAVLTHRFPSVRLESDFTVLRDQPWIVDAQLLVGGTPCQAFSIAGLRRSMGDNRGNLSLEFVRLANAIDDLRCATARPPAWILWENVPGVFSVEDNAFGAFLAGLVGSDGPLIPPAGGRWTDSGVVAGPRRVAAWRVLDARNLGLAQRRRRVFVLARGNPRGWAAAAALLPIIDSLRGHPAPRRTAGQRTAGAAAAGVGSSGGEYLGNAEGAGAGLPFLTASNLSKQFNNQMPLVRAYSLMPQNSGKDFTAREVTVAQPVLTVTRGSGNQGGDLLVQPFTLAARGRAGGVEIEFREDGLANSVLTPGGGRQATGVGAVAGELGVRRFTPRECERLQGLPDDFTLVPFRGRPAADASRYRVIGNAMAVNVMAHIGRAIAHQVALEVRRERRRKAA